MTSRKKAEGGKAAANRHPALTELFRGEDPLNVDLVAVHGLNGDALMTWTTKKSKKCWLRDADMLPSNLQHARILTYSYNATVISMFGTTSSDRILQHAHTLVAELQGDRELEGAQERPIIFLCHSLGGIIVKRALAYSASQTSPNVQHLHSIFVSTYAIVFFGTPHNGSSKASLASTGRRILDAVVPSKIMDTDGQLLDALKEGSEELQNITDLFAPLMKNFRVYFFWEQEKTDLGTRKDYVVEEQSAAPILADTERAGLPNDHRDMVRFESRSSPGFRLIAAALIRYSRDAPATISRRWVAALEMLRRKRFEEAAELLR